MQIVPLSAVPSQTTNIVLDSQSCVITVYQKRTGLYMDLSVNSTQICNTALCLNGYPVVKNTYHGLSGNFLFVDQQGTNDPDYTGLGSRYLLYFLDASDVA